ncbi:MAG: hypothetical protein COW19_08285 [Zetaproteobacteria bacterium CG12_big_fil_rev_8_21_14_0_65_55_1124]|nr:MAG: hypothetical protein AUJ58_03745 [Zetaproteobacteria bacterium CG1_02_55_237]PIS20378.1 MAG: hypothetical protein COT53_00880 [Zetaproteobacteria bacterium CG08_land_8_20_14_0_20_55_17]PIW42470.1 MAG: hypothetical protein COW19_08285 [Zetaproteobacteria bacterium CG12_big_fil_rev_8_21_14_0_65_55_1124]PIY52380.1 MAG: hypothetical protein COZ01_07920 [Zetaproteobacteria bacterium CG_4_10_14_0_8_um_filter_55_43]PIZ37159.1 MAG: hypothetical protein COY36_10020 [Zetaproteobacteria bacterium 
MIPLLLLLCLLCLLPGQRALAENSVSPEVTAVAGGAQVSAEAVMQQFAGDDEEAPERRIETKRKHQILFIMGISLLILLFLTGSLGIAMVVFDKDVFVAHLISAGLSLTLAAVHAATSIAWFWPY